MSTGQPPPPPPPAAVSPTGDADGDGLANVAEAAIDASARYQARVALITAIVALVSAILGPVVSLWINHSQIKSQGDQFSDQITSANGQSEAEFVRTQRSTAYTDFLTAFNNGAIDLLGAAGAIGSGGGTADQLNDQVDKSVTAVKDFTSTFFKVRIVASKEANEKALALYGEFSTWSGSLLVTFGQLLNGQQITAEQQDLLNNTSDEYSKLLDMADDFVTEGRKDMSSDLEVRKK
jgi:hypothetical protein